MEYFDICIGMKGYRDIHMRVYMYMCIYVHICSYVCGWVGGEVGRCTCVCV
jgi:hypothetical protein